MRSPRSRLPMGPHAENRKGVSPLLRRLTLKKRGLTPFLIVVAIAAGLLAFDQRTTQAHKSATSPFAYNEDVFPIFRARCGSCHTDGGPAPMSLLSYQAAYPWATSIRDELVAERMPPSYVD